MWEGVEREEDTFDDAYLDRVEALINRLGQNGITTLVDAHQDVFARVICGEGVPNFYAKRILEEKLTCASKWLDWFVEPLLEKSLGFCSDFDDYNFTKDSDGNPLIPEC